MKLVEILARELKEWPEKIGKLTQSSFDAEVLINDDDGTGLFPSIFLSVRHDEFGYPGVTRAQWEAERARIAAMEGAGSASQESATSGSGSDNQAQYEQELWDKVAVAATQAFITGHITHFGHENAWQDTELVSCAADYADAFMAERAKRLKELK